MEKKNCRTRYFPVSFFSIILGMAGFTIATLKAEEILKIDFGLGRYILMLTTLLFSVMTVFYIFKLIRFWDEVKKEFDHPVKLSFFPTFSISMLLLSIAFLSVDKNISYYMWAVGSVIHLALTIKIVSIWIQHDKFKITHMNPSWFIPAVGNILVPVAGVVHAPLEISWFFFSIGLVFWLILLMIFFYRIIFHNPLPGKLLPTLFILIAPPAVGFISFSKLTGSINEFGLILYYFALFLTILLIAQANMFWKIKFFLSWWAYSFPVSAMATASIMMYHETGVGLFRYISYITLALLNILIAILTIKTVKAITKRQICVEEE